MKLFFSIFISMMMYCKLFAQMQAKTIPPFTFFKQDSTAFTNQDLAKKGLLYFIFFDADCSHCQYAVSSINKYNNAFDSVSLYFVTFDKNSKINPFMDKYGYLLRGKNNVTVLQDTLQEFIVKFKPQKYPAMFLYSSEGELIHYSDNEKDVPKFIKLIKGKQ